MNTLTAAPPLPPDVYARTRQRALPFPLEEPGCRLFARARHGLWQGVHALGIESGREVLVPAYHHGSEVESLVRAGLVCRFYGKTPLLQPDEAELESLIGPRTRALYLIHHLGFPQDVERWRRWCDRHELLLIEDVAQSWFATSGGLPLGSFADMALFCLYKTCGLPDGAAVLLREPLPEGWIPADEAPTRSGYRDAARRHASWLLNRSSLLDRMARSRLGRSTYAPERDFELGDVERPPSRATTHLLARLADRQRVTSRRRTNYRHLLVKLREDVPAPFDHLPDAAVPYVLPVETSDKDDLLRRLEASGVRAFNLWSHPHPSLPADDFPDAARRRERVIGLPVHQELRAPDLDRIVASVRGKSPPPARLEREPVESVAGLEQEWDELALASRNIFATRAWIGTWWRHYGKGDLRISAWRNAEGRLVAILPLYVSRRGPLRVVRFLGHGAANELGPICRVEDRHLAARALRLELAESGIRWDLFLGSLLPGEEAWAQLVGGHVLRRHPSPRIIAAGRSWESYLDSLSTKFRKEMRYSESRLRRRYEVCYRTTQSEDRLEEDMDTFLNLHRARWDDESSFLPRSAFYRDVADSFLKQGWLRLSFLELDGAPVAARFDFRYAGVFSAYNAGRDPSWQRESLGLVLRALTMEQAFEEGLQEYRFLLGGERYKYRFAPHDSGLETFAVSSGVLGTAALTIVRGLVRTPRGRELLRTVVTK